ncbi:thiamine phosphate synthase [Companilactobacillus ginsenosidimutans]|nr:thiamine phosphate synthase [Companilactobacillus ginsenosidimutans]
MKFKSEMLQAYFVCGTQDIGDRDLPAILNEAIAAGITAFQYRDKGESKLNDEQRYQLGVILRDICNNAQISFIVDDDVDLANKLNADGVHVGQKDERITKVVRDANPDMMIGLSCQTIEQTEIANEIDRVDYIGAGPIFSTNSKPDAVAPMGLELMEDMVNISDVPIVAIGGIDNTNLQSLKNNGAVGAAFITLVTQTDDINRSVKNVLDVFK